MPELGRSGRSAVCALLLLGDAPAVAEPDVAGALQRWLDSAEAIAAPAPSAGTEGPARPDPSAYHAGLRRFAETLLGRPLAAAEQTSLAADARRELVGNPAAAAQSLATMEKVANQIVRAHHPAHVAAIRGKVRGLMVHRVPDAERRRSALWAMLEAEDPVLGVNRTAETVLTRADIAAAARLTAGRLGRSVDGPPTDEETARLVARFEQASAEEAARLSVLDAYQAGLNAAWPALTDIARSEALDAALGRGRLSQSTALAVLGMADFGQFVAAASPHPAGADTDAAMAAAANALGTTMGFTTALQAGVWPF